VVKEATKNKLEKTYLLESEKRYHILDEKLSDGVWIVQNGSVVYVNDALCSVLGYISDQLLGMDPVTMFRDDCKKHFKEMFGVLEQGNLVEYWQGVYLGNQGRELLAETHLSPTTWNGKPAILCAIKDINKSYSQEIITKEEVEHLLKENIQLRSSIKERYKFGDIIGKSPAMQEVYELILKATATNAAVAIYGESGTGKELVAKAIHDMSNRHGRAFVPVNCGAIPENLLESEFFGHRREAFTGAQIDKNGLLDLADGGILLLDEVGELSLSLQVKLLRAIEGGGYIPVGDTKTRKSNFRIISATNKNLQELVNKGLMRDDFFYRLQVIPIILPPLREHKEDIPLLVEHFLRINGNNKKPLIPSKIMEALMNYDWPGNVRELQNVLHRYLTVKRLDFMDIAKPKLVAQDNGQIEESNLEGLNFHSAVEDFEKDIIIKGLEYNQWHKAKAASALGLPRRTFFRKLRHFGLI